MQRPSLHKVAVIAGVVVLAGLLAWRTGAALRARSPALPATNARAVAVVQTAPVERATIVLRSVYVGEVTPEASVDVFARIPGLVESLAVAEGDRVRRGQVLAVLDPGDLRFRVEQARVELATERARLNQLLAGTPVEELRQAEEALRQARASLEHSRAQLRRAEELFRQGYVPQDRIDAAQLDVALQDARARSAQEQVALLQRGTSPEAIGVARAQVAEAEVALRQAESQLADRIVTAPADGVVGRRLVNRGSTVTPSTLLLQLIDIDPVVVVVALAEQELVRVTPGLQATVRTDALPGRTFTGRVVSVSPTLSSSTRTADARIELENPAHVLRPGMFVSAEIVLARREQVLAVPVDAVLERETGPIVFVIRGQTAYATPVALGASNGTLVEVTTGLADGDVIAVAGHRTLRDGMPVAVPDQGSGRP